MKNIISLAMAAVLLVGCASSEALSSRDQLKAGCLRGDVTYCNALPAAEAQVEAEKAESGRAIAIGFLGALAGAAAASNSYRRPDIIIVRRCRWC